MKLSSVKDNQRLSKKTLSPIPHLTKRILNKSLGKLENEEIFIFPNVLQSIEDLESKQMVLQEMDGVYRTSNVMGFIGYKDERLVIGSRFSSGEEDYFFQYLLENVLDIPNLVELMTAYNRDDHLTHLFIFLFPMYLQKAIRKGLFKQYQNRHYNDANVRGTMDIARQVKKNTPFSGNFAYYQREFSIDTPVMQLIRHTIEFIKRKPIGSKILNKVRDEKQMIIEVTEGYRLFDRKKVIEINQKNPIRHAYYREYRQLQELCLFILQQSKHKIGLGSRQIHGVLFDGAWLWEEYINSLIFKGFYHPRNKGGRGAQRLFAGNKGLIYPDFISRNSNYRIVSDAKYKPIQNIGNSDYLQLLSYMFRFGAKEGYYLYPDSHYSEEEILYVNEGSTYEKNVRPREDIFVKKIGLKIPQNSRTYPDFLQELKENEAEFLSKLNMTNKLP